MRKIQLITGGLLIVALIAYLFLLPGQFYVTFRCRTVPGDAMQTLKIWNRSLSGAMITGVDSLKAIEQVINLDGRRYLYRWKFDRLGDSLTTVKVTVSEQDRWLENKLLVPFSHQQVEIDAERTVRDFHQVLEAHLRLTKVRVVGPSLVDSAFCVCRTVETRQHAKAHGMMKEFPLLTSFIVDHSLQPAGPPFVTVLEWSESADYLKYDFCFPITSMPGLPVSEHVSYKKFGKVKALKAEYYGNYITSDRAWYQLLDYARQNGVKVSPLAIEVFHNNPNLGMNEIEWKADVFLPLR